MFYTDEEISVITGFLNGYLVRDCASAKVRESYIRISAGLQSHTLTKDDYVWLENALLFLRPYWWSDREDGKMLMDVFLHTQTLAKEEYRPMCIPLWHIKSRRCRVYAFSRLKVRGAV